MIVVHNSGFLVDDGKEIHRVRKGEKARLRTGDRLCFDVNKKFWFDVTHNPDVKLVKKPTDKKNAKPEMNGTDKPKLFIGDSSDENEADEAVESRNTRTTEKRTIKTRSTLANKEDDDDQQTTTGILHGKEKNRNAKRAYSTDTDDDTVPAKRSKSKASLTRAKCLDGIRCKNYDEGHRENMLHTTDRLWTPLFPDSETAEYQCPYKQKCGRTSDKYFKEFSH